MAAADKRLIQLDLLRGIAILLVLGRHAAVSPYVAGRLDGPARIWAHLGWSGVDLFFVLSGFLVGGLLMREIRTRGVLDVKRFLIRRGFKIWPGYFVYIGASFAYLWLIRGQAVGSALAKVAPNLVHLQNYLGAYVVTPLPHTWSLAVEEHFYLLLPLLLLLLRAGRRARGSTIPGLVVVAVGAFVLCLALRLYTYHAVAYTPSLIRWPTHLRIDSLFLGVLLAYVFHFHPEHFARLTARRRWLLAFGAVMLMPLALYEDDWFVVTFGFTIIALGYAAILLAVVATQPGRGFGGWLMTLWPTRVLAYIGFYSYSIYLWHILAARIPASRLAEQAPFTQLGAESRWLIIMTIYVMLALGSGIALGKIVELPALRLRERLFPSRAHALPAASESAWRAPRPDDRPGSEAAPTLPIVEAP